MKKIILILLISSSCTAQNPIINIYNKPNYQGRTSNAYYKDLDNFQNQFIGTWIFENGMEKLEIRFRKREMMFSPGGVEYYEDVLVGEYKYINPEGVEKVNSLLNLNLNHVSRFDYNLHSITQLDNYGFAPQCPECPPGTKRMYMSFDEPANDDSGLKAALILRKVVENGVEKIIAQLEHIKAHNGRSKEDIYSPSTFRDFSVPYGFYTLIKQP
ncbi:DUF6705 family protein [Flavobacterium macrobrachii]|uniref:DUF6705 domain-containing protein n=1 Tax=Flavobacterium macrobrachii TaxID=591204 RepID=A0ABS2CSX9_9FLAO|nr:DUF6705 family protein [Flavobacterium macrobrachii]MBM6498045.1 hypothetical protein [Flavobacterium macrobrachii]PZO30760.1 MAG: hypothetical protein DCF13_02675 [Flavobacteriaceae bacterium]